MPPDFTTMMSLIVFKLVSNKLMALRLLLPIFGHHSPCVHGVLPEVRDLAIMAFQYPSNSSKLNYQSCCW